MDQMPFFKSRVLRSVLHVGRRAWTPNPIIRQDELARAPWSTIDALDLMLYLAHLDGGGVRVELYRCPVLSTPTSVGLDVTTQFKYVCFGEGLRRIEVFGLPLALISVLTKRGFKCSGLVDERTTWLRDHRSV
jgi:hypothetical protein